MPPGISLQSDFTAGELSPSLLARVDLAKYSKGCRTLRNFMVQSHGPAVKRPGFQLLGDLPGPAVLIEFVFNNDQAYALIFGEKWLRVATHDGFVMSGATPYQIASPYTLNQARQLSCVQSADVLFIACQGVAPQRLIRLGHDSWQFQAMTFTAPVAAPAWDSPAVEFINEAKDSSGEISEAQLVTPYTYYVTAVNSDGKESGLSSGKKITGPSSNNWQAGDYIAVHWKAVADAVEYRIYKAEFSGRPGYIATIGIVSYKDYNVSPSVSEGAPKYVNPFPNGDYPGAVCLFEQRLVFASTPKRPQTIWMSKSGDYSNFATYTPVADDSPIELTIASQEVSPANWMVPLRSLIFGTPGMEWEIAGRGDAAFSAKNAKATPQSYWGSSLKRAMIVGNVILHVSSSGSQVRNLQYDFGSDSYGGTDLSILASHLLEKRKIIDWAYQKNPDSIIWAVCDDGILLGLTFQAEHQISAWHRHDTQGRFTSVCSVPHGEEHDLFTVVLRNGTYYLERMAERYLGGDPSRAVFMDCALTYEGAATKTISGLGHLEGQTVGVFSRGAVEPPRKVVSGRITLDAESPLVTVGLIYTADLETMPVEVAADTGASVGLKKQISTINITFHESLGVKAGLSTVPGSLDRVKWQDVKWRTTEPYGHPPEPFSGIKHLVMPHGAENTLSVCIRSEHPTPVRVQAVMGRIEVKP
ncbi:hypothetical protein LJC46_04200 [Desulfovibrio sp. OttesenSCG-928-G15]|nr:hypothetical protein [Desulfovibrio sp. OttesenSCG-928-G15]